MDDDTKDYTPEPAAGLIDMTPRKPVVRLVAFAIEAFHFRSQGGTNYDLMLQEVEEMTQAYCKRFKVKD